MYIPVCGVMSVFVCVCVCVCMCACVCGCVYACRYVHLYYGCYLCKSTLTTVWAKKEVLRLDLLIAFLYTISIYLHHILNTISGLYTFVPNLLIYHSNIIITRIDRSGNIK